MNAPEGKTILFSTFRWHFPAVIYSLHAGQSRIKCPESLQKLQTISAVFLALRWIRSFDGERPCCSASILANISVMRLNIFDMSSTFTIPGGGADGSQPTAAIADVRGLVEVPCNTYCAASCIDVTGYGSLR